MAAEFLSATILLILVIDPFGNVPLVAAALAATPAGRRARVVLRECLIAYAVLLAFMFGGHAFLTLMHVSETALSIAGGVILFLIALRMVFSHPGRESSATRRAPIRLSCLWPSRRSPAPRRWRRSC